MSEIFGMENTFRQSQEREMSRITEVKDSLVRTGINKVVNQFMKLFGNSKLVDVSTDFKQTEGETSTSIVFEGTMTVVASVEDNQGSKKVSVKIPVKGNSIEMLDDVELKKIVAETKPEESKIETEQTKVASLPVDLSKFEIVDDGSEFLKIYHSAMDTGAELGVIHKNEYSTLTNKEVVLKEIFENQILGSHLENHYELKFEGSFVEPQIQVKADLSQVKRIDLVEPKEEVEVQKDLLLAKQTEGYRLAQEVDEQKVASQKAKLESQITRELVLHLADMGFVGAKILSTDTSSLNVVENSIDGSVSIKAAVHDSGDIKNVTIPIVVSASSYILPKKDVVSEFLKIAENVTLETEKQLNQEMKSKLEEINKLEDWTEKQTEAIISDSKIEKVATADSGGMQYFGPVDVLQVEKHLLGLPEDTELGTIIFADGYYWKLTDKNKNQLSKGEGDGNIWTFTKVDVPKDAPKDIPKLSL
jgi:hypothetical protein